MPPHQPTINLQTIFPPTTIFQKPFGPTTSDLLQLFARLQLAGRIQGHNNPSGIPVRLGILRMCKCGLWIEGIG